MANFIREMQKKKRRKKRRQEKTNAAVKSRQATKGKQTEKKQHSQKSELAEYIIKFIKKQNRRYGKKAMIAIAVAAVAIVGMVYMNNHVYSGYKILHTSEQEDIISTKYIEINGKILRYSPEGVSLVNKKLEALWNITYSMENPVADVKNGWAVIADRDGTNMEIVNEDGVTGSVVTPYNIVKARISSKGMVAAILDNGSETWINFYSSDGTLIAENQTTMLDPGYPMDVAISDDGIIMMVTYQFVDGGDTTSYVAFYNFGDVGQTADDRIVSGYEYEGTVIPQVLYLDGNQSVALRDDGFSVYKGKQIPEEEETVEVEREIVSTFCDEDTIGIVFKNDNKEKQYTMRVYSASGKMRFEKDFNIPYTTIKMSEDHIIMYNSSQICVLQDDGSEKFMSSIDGTINDFFKIGWNKYVLVLDYGVNVIELR